MDFNARLSSDLGQFKFRLLASKPPHQRKKYAVTTERISKTSLATKKVVNVGGGQNRDTSETRGIV